jgi:hypothetical protein
MTGKTQRKRIITLLLTVILFGAQFHICADQTWDSSSSPVCQLCSTANSEAVPLCQGMAIIASTNRIELLPEVMPVCLDLPTAISPRAPPIF